MFLTNNHTSFYLWLNEKLVKRQKMSNIKTMVVAKHNNYSVIIFFDKM